MVRYRSRRGDGGAIRERMRGLAAERRRFGYRSLYWLLGREGVRVNHKTFGDCTVRSAARRRLLQSCVHVLQHLQLARLRHVLAAIPQPPTLPGAQ